MSFDYFYYSFRAAKTNVPAVVVGASWRNALCIIDINPLQ